MKKILIVCVFALGFLQAQAQLEVKASPIPLLFGAFVGGVEYNLSDAWGIEADIAGIDDTFVFLVSGKQYFSPKYGADKFHLAAFIGVADGAAGGFYIGQKWLSKEGVIFEIAAGLGRSSDTIFPYGKLHIGYRFGNKNN